MQRRVGESWSAGPVSEFWVAPRAPLSGVTPGYITRIEHCVRSWSARSACLAAPRTKDFGRPAPLHVRLPRVNGQFL